MPSAKEKSCVAALENISDSDLRGSEVGAVRLRRLPSFSELLRANSEISGAIRQKFIQ